MDDVNQLSQIQQELEQINQHLMKLFPVTHPLFKDVFENVGAAGYYIQESVYCIKAVIKTAQGDEYDEDEDE
ncbi:hypothetical protein DSM106972_015190 [Dulcicalothrix desertica PCC 7102]|uniref:Uncharacterized protein n=1 Tax=Dulcicalothrix desertica PCC 7102 TaxID=232991 RepID=A0A433VQL7_9CYAN|nr:hypothetical protein [Dulcicalothrix desertica]RUT08351.1 hypothetical protein DSM106972_015190 [Dulcicalothrix desertica PCC 7102]TWH40217.1 hypothetical protein CAL7102_09521 [Dulcicalothrix desertica PCC 7102]